MAKVGEISLTPEQKELYYKALRVEEVYSETVVDRKNIIWRNRNLIEVEDRSIIDQCAELWNGLSQAEQDAWVTAASYCNLTGWKLFFQDTSYRILNNLSGLATPNNLHQYKVIKVVKPSDAHPLDFTQYHHSPYYLKTRIVGSKDAYKWVYVDETCAPPIVVEFNYYTDIIQRQDYHIFHLTGLFRGLKNGVDTAIFIHIDLEKQHPWGLFSHSFAPDLDTIYYYYISFYMYQVYGTLMIDNVNFFHDGENWALDPSCDNIKAVNYVHNDWQEPSWQLSWGDIATYFDSFYL
jgi:hypothetical protein